MMKTAIRKIKKKLSGHRGFSLGELLAATIILLLASQVMAEGVTFAVRMYNETLTNSIETELRYATSITYDENTGKLLTYFSPAYGQSKSGFLSIDSDDNEQDSGEIAIKATEDGRTVYRRLLSGASYSSFELKAKVENVTYNKADNLFTVTLLITDRNNKEQVENTFNVIPINNLKIN